MSDVSNMGSIADKMKRLMTGDTLIAMVKTIALNTDDSAEGIAKMVYQMLSDIKNVGGTLDDMANLLENAHHDIMIELYKIEMTSDKTHLADINAHNIKTEAKIKAKTKAKADDSIDGGYSDSETATLNVIMGILATRYKGSDECIVGALLSLLDAATAKFECADFKKTRLKKITIIPNES